MTQLSAVRHRTIYTGLSAGEPASAEDSALDAPIGDRAPPLAKHERLLDELEQLLSNRRRRQGDRRILDRDARDRRIGAAQPEAAEPSTDAAAARPGHYGLAVIALVLVLLAALATANFHLAPWTYNGDRLAGVAEELAQGNNYALFDLNLDVRGLRREHIRRLPITPDVAVLGASHWQEANADLVPHRLFYNAHVHRDYHEDLLAVTEMLIRYDRLPDTLVLSIRDLTFAPIDERTDYLWLTGLSDYRAMMARLQLESHSWFEMMPERHWLGLFSLSTMLSNAWRELTEPAKPGPTRTTSMPTLDVLQADGSIRWSTDHLAQFTPERRREQVDLALQERLHYASKIDPRAVESIDRLLGLLTTKGVRVVLIHPPFNPEFYERLGGSPYSAGLNQVETLTRNLAQRHGAIVVGSFDPARSGCVADMYIDSEHSNPDCLRRVLTQIPNL